MRDEDLEREAMKVDISALLGGDIYAPLRTRSQRARSASPPNVTIGKALLERKRCLKKLQKDLDIPDEVLASLPSAEQIRAKAAAKGAAVAEENPASSASDSNHGSIPEDSP